MSHIARAVTCSHLKVGRVDLLGNVLRVDSPTINPSQMLFRKDFHFNFVQCGQSFTSTDKVLFLIIQYDTDYTNILYSELGMV